MFYILLSEIFSVQYNIPSWYLVLSGVWSCAPPGRPRVGLLSTHQRAGLPVLARLSHLAVRACNMVINIEGGGGEVRPAWYLYWRSPDTEERHWALGARLRTQQVIISISQAAVWQGRTSNYVRHQHSVMKKLTSSYNQYRRHNGRVITHNGP